MIIKCTHKIPDTSIGKEEWIVEIINEDENWAFQGRVNEKIYKAIEYLLNKIKKEFKN